MRYRSFMKMVYACACMMMFGGIVSAQERSTRPGAELLKGSIYGTISIQEVSGNNVGNFSCSNLTVGLNPLDGKRWYLNTTAKGNFGQKLCTFSIPNIPSGKPFVAALGASFPNACDEKKFEATTSFPMEVKPREKVKYDFVVMRVRCVLVK